jgi:hypothetical protein
MANVVDILRTRLNRLVESGAITQRKLAHAAGHQDGWMSDFLNPKPERERHMRLEDVGALADELGVSIEALLAPIGQDETLEDTVARLGLGAKLSRSAGVEDGVKSDPSTSVTSQKAGAPRAEPAPRVTASLVGELRLVADALARIEARASELSTDTADAVQRVGHLVAVATDPRDQQDSEAV